MAVRCGTAKDFAELKPLEITRESLTMIREIGQGEFGVVMEASAVNLHRSVKVQTVAVKMLKNTSNSSAAQSFKQEAVSAMGGQCVAQHMRT